MSRPAGKSSWPAKTSPIAAAVPWPPAKPVSIICPKLSGTAAPPAPPSGRTITASAISPTTTCPRMMIHATTPCLANPPAASLSGLPGRSSSSPAKTTAIRNPGHVRSTLFAPAARSCHAAGSPVNAASLST